MSDIDPKSATAATPGIPGSASSAHPTDAIPLPAHGFEKLDDVPIRDLAGVSAAEVITRAAVLLIGASAQKLGLAYDGEPYLDLDDARPLITALAAMLVASEEYLGSHNLALRDGLSSLQAAFREASRYPDEPGRGPGEKYLH